MRSFSRVVPVALIVLAASLMGVPPAGAAFPGANGKIAFERLDGDFEIYTMNGDGTGGTDLTANPALYSDDYAPAWSPDGSQIAFHALREGAFDAGYDIYVMNADGTGQTRLTTGSDSEYDPAWSPDGTKIAFTRCCPGGSAEIYVMNANGTGQTDLTNDPAWDRDAAWSPDSTKIAFDTNRDDPDSDELYVMNADGSGQQDLSNNAAQDFSPDWSPDGTKIAFVSDRDGWDWEIYAMNADGTGQTDVSQSNGIDEWPAWSPDGTKIAFISYRNQGNPDVFVMNADGSGAIDLTNSSASERNPDWQPLPGSSSSAAVVSVADFSYSPKTTTIAQGQAVKWVFKGPSTHSATDRSGMGLFDSGARAPGSTYSMTFIAAGTYPYRCTVQPAMVLGSIGVPVLVSPTSGSKSTVFTVTWSSAPAPAGDVFDVQIKRPGASSFVTWKTGQAAQSGSFKPDAGSGTYSFRSRLRNAATGKGSQYSPPQSVTVR
jgi:TolB protein